MKSLIIVILIAVTAFGYVVTDLVQSQVNVITATLTHK